MNKYEVITSESKKIVKEELKNKFSYLNPKNMLSRERFSQKISTTLNNGCILAIYQIILNKDVFMMNEERLQDVLSEMKIDFESFWNDINKYNNFSYVIVNRYIEYLQVANNDSLSDDDKIEETYSCFRDFNNYANLAKDGFDFKIDSISAEKMGTIDNMSDIIYQNTIRDKITNYEAKDSDLIKSVYDRKK